jgi:CRP/FNR family transcriptional regulator, cyclic AMP receptor protein
MEFLYERTKKIPSTFYRARDSVQERPENGSAEEKCQNTTLPSSGTKRKDAGAVRRAGEFCHGLSPRAICEFESLASVFHCDGGAVLLTEGEQPNRVLILLEGKVKLSMNSIEGRRLILGIAAPGDVLGLAGVVSGSSYEITAEAQSPCGLRWLPRQSFLDFMLRNPVASQNVGRQLSIEYKRACEQLRLVGLTVTASTKLARLLVEWCADGHQTERGIRIRCSLTHGEIGEYIGVARETVSRTLTDFKHRELVEQDGSTLFISSLRALEIYAGQVDS